MESTSLIYMFFFIKYSLFCLIQSLYKQAHHANVADIRGGADSSFIDPVRLGDVLACPGRPWRRFQELKSIRISLILTINWN